MRQNGRVCSLRDRRGHAQTGLCDLDKDFGFYPEYERKHWTVLSTGMMGLVESLKKPPKRLCGEVTQSEEQDGSRESLIS